MSGLTGTDFVGRMPVAISAELTNYCNLKCPECPSGLGALTRPLGLLSVDDFKTIMEARKPGLAGPTVPAQGLYLMRINYPRPLGDYDEDL